MSNTREPDRGTDGAGSPLDAAIDRAVRRMMNVDPPAGMRRRVLSRLDSPVRSSGFFPRFAFAFGALAVIVLAVLVIRRDGPAPAAPASIQVATAPAARPQEPAALPP